jgi:hypothetical protein
MENDNSPYNSPYDSPYQIGGSLQLNSPTYVTRRADRELYEGLRAGDFCYVLNCRQMGKSSLRVQTMARLQAAGVACVAVQMTDIIDEEITPEQFYAGVIDSITQDLELDFDNMAWWEANAGLSLVNRFSKFLETVLLQRLAGKVVIFIDEIDRVLSLPFRVNGFFAAIRECYNKRADNPIYRRLTFSLLGVATPSDLIEDKRSTPFNIGRAIELHGFTRSEAQPLAQGLRVANPDETLAAILHWTGGQPFLTQKVCRLVADQAVGSGGAGSEGTVADWVDGLVRSRVIHNWAANDEPEHLRTIRDRLLRDEHRAARRLGLYQQILAQNGLPTSRANVEHIELRLTGLVVEQAGRLQLYNAIYAAIFNAEWAVRKLADLRPYSKAIDAWLASDRMDKSHLLQGGALAKAKQWSADKVLPPEDYAFLAASQELVTEETEEARQVLARANRTLEEANREATVRMNSANRRLRIGSGILMGTIALFVLTGVYANQRISNGIGLERRATALWRNPSSHISSLDTLIDTLTIAQDLNLLLLNSPDQKKTAAFASDYPEISRSLRTSLNSVLGTTKFKGNFREFSKDGQRLVTFSEEESTSWLYDLSGQQLAKFKGSYPRLSEDGQWLLAFSEEESTSWLYTLSGQQLAEFKGGYPRLSKDGQRLATYSREAGTSWLYALSGQQLAKFKGRYPSFSKDDQRLVTSSVKEDTSWLYDLSGQQLAEFKGIFRSFTEDGQRLVTSSVKEDTSWLYDLSGQQLAEFKGSEPSFSEDGQRLVTSSDEEDTSWLYDFSGQQLAEFKGSESSFSEDGQQLVTSSDEEDTSWLYDLSSQQLAEFKGREPQFSKDGQRLITFSREKVTSWLYDLSGQRIAEFKGRFRSFSKDGQQLVTVSEEEDTSWLYDLSSQQIFVRIQASAAYIIPLSKNKQQLVTFSEEENASRLYDFSGQRLAEFKGRFRSFSEDGQRLVTFSREENTSWLYDLSGQQLAEFKGSYPRLSEDGQRLATYSYNAGTSWLHDLSGQQLAEFKGRYPSFSKDDQRLVTSSREEDTSWLYTLSGQQLAEFKGRFRSFSKDGQQLVTFSEEAGTSSWLYNLSGQRLAEFKGRFPRFSEDGQRLVTSSREENISWLYDLSGQQLAKFKGREPQFSKDGQRLITFSEEEDTSWLYDLSGQRIAEFEGRSPSFSADGQRLVTSLVDEDISNVYDTTGTLLAEFPGSVVSYQDEQLGFTPDGNHLFTRANDGEYHLWQLDNGLDDLIARGCDWVRPYLQANPEETRAAFCK